jgi:hypothetical protein
VSSWPQFGARNVKRSLDSNGNKKTGVCLARSLDMFLFFAVVPAREYLTFLWSFSKVIDTHAKV